MTRGSSFFAAHSKDKIYLSLNQIIIRMEAIVFVKNYMDYLDEISQVIKPELQPIIDELKEIDPHDLVRPDTFFDSENSARGYVWSMFVKRVKRYSTSQ